MSPMHQSRSRVFGIATMFAFTLLAPVAVSAQEEVADTTQQEVPVLASVAAPAVVSTSGEDGRAIAAERALLSGDFGSMQEEHLRAIVAAAPSWDETSGYGAVEASRATIGSPATSTSAEQTRVLAAQQALEGGDLGSLQEDVLLAVMSAGQSWDETSGYGAVETSRATIGHSATSTTGEAALLAQFRAIERALSLALGADLQVPADVRWAPAPASSVEASNGLSPDYIPAALTSGQRAESAHLATVLLPGEDAVEVRRTQR
jgi:hypothetical protein